MSIHQERYSGKVTPVGNSKGIRLDAAFFKAHPEFCGEVAATVLGEGQLLLSARAEANPVQDEAASDPLLAAFLGFLERDMLEHPETIRPADEAQLARIARLVEGVEVD